VSEYEYELRRGAAVIATGRIQLEQQPTPGETLTLGSKQVRVEDVLALRGSRRLILSQR
jgi:hypothetical protein